MCQMCDEYENELRRMGLIEDARKFREASHEGADRVRPEGKDLSVPAGRVTEKGR
jgi:hypothetical protein